MEATSVFFEKWRHLNPANRKQASDFMDFLLTRQRMEDQGIAAGKSNIRLGIWKDMPCYIADDFDEPLDDFKEYM